MNYKLLRIKEIHISIPAVDFQASPFLHLPTFRGGSKLSRLSREAPLDSHSEMDRFPLSTEVILLAGARLELSFAFSSFCRRLYQRNVEVILGSRIAVIGLKMGRVSFLIVF